VRSEAVPGTRADCRCAGVASGAALLLIHGFPTASWDWEALWPTLTARWRVLAFDAGGAADGPLTLIDGAADPISGAHMAARYRELVPRADVTLLEGIGHYPQVEAPGAVVEAYSAFRARVGA
jgi:pimeloyl-ACP methyl ester carboxylesterase